MAFWGIEVKPGKAVTLSHDPDKGRLHLTQATLGLSSSPDDKRTVIQCNVGDRPGVLLCSLLPGKRDTYALNLEFDEAEEDDVVFSVLGPSSVHLSGFFEERNPEDVYGEDITHSDSDDEEEDEDFSSDDEDRDFIDDDEDVLVPNKGVKIEEVEVQEEETEKKGKKKGKKEQKEDEKVACEDEDGVPVLGKRKKMKRHNGEAEMEPMPKKQATEGNVKGVVEEAPAADECKTSKKKKKKKNKKKGKGNDSED